jgi:phosphocarrier protein HPr
MSAPIAVELVNATGLHARPAVKFTKLAKTFPATGVEVALAAAGPWIDAKSVAKVMALKAPRGAMLFMRASGEEAAAALAALGDLVRGGFGEADGAG